VEAFFKSGEMALKIGRAEREKGGAVEQRKRKGGGRW
jgi:hypothetical protein